MATLTPAEAAALIRPGERVGIILPNMPEYLVSLFGTWMAGGVTVPINPLMVPEEVAALLRNTGTRFVVCLDVLLPLAARGLADQGVDAPEIERYLGVLERRVQSGYTGSRWILTSLNGMRNQGSAGQRQAHRRDEDSNDQRTDERGHGHRAEW